jgi:ketosteroid isomerase-like protein
MTLGTKRILGTVVTIMLLILFGGGNSLSAADIQQTIAKYRLAQEEFEKGNPQPFKDICSHADDVTILGGFGGFEKGWNAQVEKRYDWASARFKGGESQRHDVENISLVVTPELAYSVDIERTRFRAANAQEARSMALRVTSIFRLEDGDWKLVHRHADPLVERQGIPGK